MQNFSWLLVDFVFFEDICNLNCKYCGDPNNIPEIALPNLSVLPFDMRKENIIKLLFRIKNLLTPSIIKLSGGEIFCRPSETLEICDIATRLFKKIQILTNGTLLNEKIIKHLCGKNRITLQFSLDGHTPELNKYRFTSKKLIDHCLKNIKKVANYCDVEINTVLTDTNTHGLTSFIRFISKMREDTTYDIAIYPFPVRGHEDMLPKPEVYEKALKEIEYDSSLHDFLPPLTYLRELLEFLKEGRRLSPCYAPLFVIGVNEHGYVQGCPCAEVYITNIANSVETKSLQVKFQRHLYSILVNGANYKVCKKCFTHYEVLSEYFRGTLSLKELTLLPLFRGIEKDLMSIKAYIDKLKFS